MPRIKVHKPFTVTHQDYTQREFQPGEHEIDEGLAMHWYVKANSEPIIQNDPEVDDQVPVTPTPKKSRK